MQKIKIMGFWESVMMYEISLRITEKNYVDSLIVALVQQGYEVYFDYEKEHICFQTVEDEVREIKR